MSTSTSFQAEREMLPGALARLPGILGLSETLSSVLSEAIIGHVIPDILIGCWSKQPHQSTTKLTHVDATVLALLESHDELSTEEILSQIFLSRVAAEKTFRKLERIGATTRTSEGGVRISDTHSTLAVEIIAIEFKLRRWKEALAQAQAYRGFADRSYVVLDVTQLQLTTQIKSAFAEAEIGLISQTPTELKLVIDAKPRRQPCSDRIAATQKLVNALFTGSTFNCLNMPAISERQRARLTDAGCPYVAGISPSSICD